MLCVQPAAWKTESKSRKAALSDWRVWRLSKIKIHVHLWFNVQFFGKIALFKGGLKIVGPHFFPDHPNVHENGQTVPNNGLHCHGFSRFSDFAGSRFMHQIHKDDLAVIVCLFVLVRCHWLPYPHPVPMGILAVCSTFCASNLARESYGIMLPCSCRDCNQSYKVVPHR